jgi:hypothetical protein
LNYATQRRGIFNAKAQGREGAKKNSGSLMGKDMNRVLAVEPGPGGTFGRVIQWG